VFACGRLRSAGTALALRCGVFLAVTENVGVALRYGLLRRVALYYFQGTFIVNVKKACIKHALQCVALQVARNGD